jgi:hypothetical protein
MLAPHQGLGGEEVPGSLVGDWKARNISYDFHGWWKTGRQWFDALDDMYVSLQLWNSALLALKFDHSNQTITYILLLVWSPSCLGNLPAPSNASTRLGSSPWRGARASGLGGLHMFSVRAWRTGWDICLAEPFKGLIPVSHSESHAYPTRACQVNIERSAYKRDSSWKSIN